MKKFILFIAFSAFILSANAQYDIIKKGIKVGSGGTKTLIDSTELKALNGVTGNINSTFVKSADLVDYSSILDNEFELIKSLGGRNQNMSIGASIRQGLGSALQDGVIQLQLLYPSTSSYVIDTLMMVMSVQGAYTGDNENRIGLYRYTLANDTYTLVASIPNNSELWKGAAGTTVTAVLSTPYTTSANEILYSAVIYNSSAATTGPSLVGTNLTASGIVDKGFLGTKYYINAQKTGQNTLAASFTGAIRTNFCPFIIVR